MNKISIPKYSLGEEIINAISHGIGAALSIVGLVILIVLSCHKQNKIAIVACAVYGSLSIILYIISCIYHSLSPKVKGKKILRVIDHCNVYLLVAATYTPLTLVCLRDKIGYLTFWFVWIITIIGMILTCIDIDKYQKLSCACHLLTGWAVLFTLKDLLTKMPILGIKFLILGGLLYSIGAVLYLLGSHKKYMHSIFHFFCLAGSLFHFFMITLIV